MAVIKVVEAHKPEIEGPLRYFTGQRLDHPAAYPYPHLADDLFRDGSDITPLRIMTFVGWSAASAAGVRKMLRAGWIPTSLGQSGSPDVRVVLDAAKAAELLEAFDAIVEVVAVVRRADRVSKPGR